MIVQSLSIVCDQLLSSEAPAPALIVGVWDLPEGGLFEPNAPNVELLLLLLLEPKVKAMAICRRGRRRTRQRNW